MYYVVIHNRGVLVIGRVKHKRVTCRHLKRVKVYDVKGLKDGDLLRRYLPDCPDC